MPPRGGVLTPVAVLLPRGLWAVDDQVAPAFMRCVHRGAMAPGPGLALHADSRFLRGIARPLMAGQLAELRRSHGFVGLALAVLWVSGLALLSIRTGFEAANISPKPTTKVLMVTALTPNAPLIGQIVSPLLERSAGLRFADLGLRRRLVLGMVGAVSAAGWITALCLGVFAVLRGMDGAHLAIVVAAICLPALAGGAAMAAIVPAITPRLPERRRALA